ncbi:MAG: FecR family protein, partial [Sphingobacteriales bacterium]
QEEIEVREWYNSFINDDDHVSSFSSLQKADLKMRIKKAIDENIVLQQQANPGAKNSGKNNLRYLLLAVSGVAAMVMLVIGLKVFNSSSINRPSATIGELISITNKTKSIQEQVLSDGSHVWLYPGAKIQFAKDFTGNTREVSMTGESFFDVAKNPEKPFIIYSSHMVTKVWGTSFRVRDSEITGFADVTVVTGKVSVKTIKNADEDLKEVMLHPNEQVTYVKQKDVLKTSKQVNDTDLNIWKKINLSFDNRPIKEVIPVLNRHYNVNIISTDDKLNGYLLNADFNGLNFVSVMEILRKTLNISYEINNTSIILKNNN